jgi:hypothetical protein
MKKFLKNLIVSASLISLVSCSQPSGATGKWENVVKDASGVIVTTTLTVNETMDNFTGNMSSKVEGNTNEIINSSLKNIDFSGYVSGKILVISEMKNSNDPYFTKSTLTVSEDGNRIVLSPSGLIFVKK